MKIVILNGSPRNHGATAKILQTFAQQFSLKNDVQTEYIRPEFSPLLRHN